MRIPAYSRLAALALLSVAPALSAQQTTPRPWAFGLSATSMAIVPAAANAASVHNQTFGLQLDAAYVLKNVLYVGADLGPQMLKDHAGFTQLTTAGDKSSTASLVYFSAVAGPRTPAFGISSRWTAALALLGGMSATTGKRSIDNCVDCSSSDIKVPGGAFVQPTLLIGGSGARMRIAQRQYLTGDGIRYVTSLGAEFGGR